QGGNAHIDAGLEQQRGSLPSMMRLMIEQVEDQASVRPSLRNTLHVLIIENMIEVIRSQLLNPSNDDGIERFPRMDQARQIAIQDLVQGGRALHPPDRL